MASSNSIIGCLLGTAVGDALGLPYEGLSRQRQRRLYPTLGHYHLILGKGLVSDDTEHTCIVAQALIVSSGDVEKFQTNLAWRLRFWLLGLPAGIGFVTLRAILKLWLGFTPNKSGVFSAGNGPAMRSAILGVCYGEDGEQLREWVKVSTRITHTDPKAEWGALAVAIAAFLASRQSCISPQNYYDQLQDILGKEAGEFLELIQRSCASADTQESIESFVASLGLEQGVSGYIYHTIPVVIQVWLKHQQDYAGGILEIIRCGGDTDTTAAILGGIIGAAVGKQGIPNQWLENLWECPRTVAWIKQLGKSLADSLNQESYQQQLSLPIYGLVLRNLVFTIIILFHGFRRLLPPY